MKYAAPLVLCLALSACAPGPDLMPETPSYAATADGGVAAGVGVTKQALTGLGVTFFIDRPESWDAAISTISNPCDPGKWCGHALQPASQYLCPTYNMHVSANTSGSPAVYSNYTAATSVAFDTMACNRLGGVRTCTYQYPSLYLAPGHYYVWFMPRCAGGSSWPAYGPDESYWRYEVDVPTSGTLYKSFHTGGFSNNKTYWRGWFQGCGHALAEEWTNGTTLEKSQCVKFPSGCDCTLGPPDPAHPNGTTTYESLYWQ